MSEFQTPSIASKDLFLLRSPSSLGKSWRCGFRGVGSVKMFELGGDVEHLPRWSAVRTAFSSEGTRGREMPMNLWSVLD